MSSKSLEGKIGVVFGVANKRSIAWAIAQAWAAAGAKLIFNYQGERLKENVEDLVSTFGSDVPLYPCDVTSDAEIAEFFQQVRQQTDRRRSDVALGRFCAQGSFGGRFFEHLTRSLSFGAQHQRLFACRAGQGGCAADDERRKHHFDDLLRLH